MLQDYRQLDADQLEGLEKQTLRTIVQALQEYSREAREIFETTKAPSKNEVIVLAEDLLQYALEVAECYPINKRFAGFIDYKRVRWIPTPFGLFPQVLLVDAKAATERIRTTLQQSQLPLDAEFVCSKDTAVYKKGDVVRLKGGVPPHLDIPAYSGPPLAAITSSVFVHFYYQDLKSESPPYRRLLSLFGLMLPHQLLKGRYNPDPQTTFFGQGKHSPKRQEDPRIRVYFTRLRKMQPWRLQELRYPSDPGPTKAVWRDQVQQPDGKLIEVLQPFQFLSR